MGLVTLICFNAYLMLCDAVKLLYVTIISDMSSDVCDGILKMLYVINYIYSHVSQIVMRTLAPRFRKFCLNVPVLFPNYYIERFSVDYKVSKGLK